ncbi:uncharacterized protein LOC135171125 [Diachasmimorpha longicaudata]|uniref:uncharacterized protein LOC135171125 n=1 Tax=Diachasmimorpha longicaudata TaxID=58733 RepID=UPI0030B9061C
MDRGTGGKSSKESQSVDEKNYTRRLKGSYSSQKIPEANIKQSEISRAKTVGVAKKTGATGLVLPKNAKSKLRSPTHQRSLSTSFKPRVNPHQPSKSERRSHQEQSKQKSTMKVQQDSAEAIPQSKKKDSKPKSKPDDNLPDIKETPSASSDTNGKSSDTAEPPKDNGKQTDDGQPQQPDVQEPKEIIIFETESTNSEIVDLVEISDDSLVLELSEKPEDTLDKEEPLITSDKKQSEVSNNEANPADVLVESTTSETSPSDLKSQENPSDSNGDQVKPQDDPSFVSYDAAIMLKDVQIKLNDCLRDNSKLMDVTDPNASVSEAFKDLSFGRTLRGISGRNSIGRMRHVTVRDRQRTPNDSLFVNTSSASFSQNDALRFTSGFLESSSPNGTPLDRKRKREAQGSDSVKKPRYEGNSILNTSLEYIKNLRRPVQVSTPNPKGFKFDIGEKMEGSESTTGVDSTGEAKKWCVVM